MVDVTFKFSAENLQRVRTAMVGLYPIPMITDPENEEEMIPEYTESQWSKKCVENWIKKQVQRFEEMEAKKEIKLTSTDNLVDEITEV